MKHATFFISVVALSSLFLSCKQSTKFLRASSMANEVVVVMDDNVWENGEAGRAVFELFNTPVPALPQPEPHFKILHVAPQNFSSTFKTVSYTHLDVYKRQQRGDPQRAVRSVFRN